MTTQMAGYLMLAIAFFIIMIPFVLWAYKMITDEYFRDGAKEFFIVVGIPFLGVMGLFLVIFLIGQGGAYAGWWS